MEAAEERAAPPRDAQRLVEQLRSLLRRLEARQRQLRAGIASCDRLAAEMAALRAALPPPPGAAEPRGAASPAARGPCG